MDYFRYLEYRKAWTGTVLVPMSTHWFHMNRSCPFTDGRNFDKNYFPFVRVSTECVMYNIKRFKTVFTSYTH